MVSTSEEIYCYRRTVRYGDCDASCNYYTPRALEYALEALAGWYEEILGLRWSDLVARWGWEVAFTHAGCRYLKTLTAGESVQLRVSVVAVEEAQIRFSVAGCNGGGALCFVADLTASLVKLRKLEPIAMPERIWELVERYRSRSGGTVETIRAASAPVGEVTFPAPVAGSEVPFVLQRRIAYGECAPSGTIYPPHLFDFLLEATGAWYERELGISWLQQNRLKIGNPFLEVSCDYLKPLLAGQLVSTAVSVARLGNSSISYAVAGYDRRGDCSFRARLSACYTVEEAGALRATPFPDSMRKKITAYQSACAGEVVAKTSSKRGAPC